jgi:hypothetical protein
MLVAAHAFVVAGVGGRGAVEKCRGVIVGAGAIGQQVRIFVEGFDQYRSTAATGLPAS